MSFDASLPNLFAEDLRAAIGATNAPGLGTASYAAPGVEAIPFILSKVALSGGISNDTQEYPFFGGWSSTPLNEKPQSIKIEGAIRGSDCLKRRNALLEALRNKTSDDNPGYLALASWGRFPVVVSDWDVSEEMDKQGQFPLSLTFTRAGLSDATRQAQTLAAVKSLSTALATQAAAAQSAYTAAIDGKLTTATQATAFAGFAKNLRDIVGRVQATASAINTMTAKIQGIQNLIDQGITSPATLAEALFGGVAAVVAGVVNTAQDIDSLLSGESTEGLVNAVRNAWNCALAFLSNASYESGIQAATVKEAATANASKNLYRALSLYGAAAILPSIEDLSYDKFKELFALLLKLEDSIDRENADLYAACTELRVAVAQKLDALELNHILSLKLPSAMPTLALAQKLGMSYEELRAMNASIEDEFLVLGSVNYV